MIKTKLKTAPVKKPVSLDEAKEHLRVDIGWTDEDDYIEALIATATKIAESYLRRKLITQTWYQYLNFWPAGDSIILPFGNLQSVTSVEYTDTAGDDTEWSDTEYNVDIQSDPGRVVLEYGYSWPSASLHPQNPIVVEFVCGYGLSGSSVDERILQAIKIMISDMYENREDVIVGMTVTANLRGATAKLFPCILWAEHTA